MRNLCDDCKSCEDNDKSLGFCFDVCMVPTLILEEKENNRNFFDIRKEQINNGS